MRNSIPQGRFVAIIQLQPLPWGLLTLDEKSTSSGIAEPYECATKNEGENRGKEGTTPVTMVFAQKLEKQMCAKKEKEKKVRVRVRITTNHGDEHNNVGHPPSGTVSYTPRQTNCLLETYTSYIISVRNIRHSCDW